MRTFKSIAKALLIAALAVLFALPVGMLYAISVSEQQKYETPLVQVGPERAYGERCAVTRMDMAETITVSGRVVSGEFVYMELADYSEPYSIRWVRSQGDAVRQGETIGYYNGEAVTASATGVIREISLGSKPYIRLDSIERLLLECYVSDVELKILKRDSLELTDENGVPLTVADIDLIRSDGGTRVLLSYDAPTLTYGAAVEELKLRTGVVYRQALAVEADCVYRKEKDGQHYVRLVDENACYLREAPVEVGYTNGSYICVSGVQEGDWCDSGYKALVEAGDARA